MKMKTRFDHIRIMLSATYVILFIALTACLEQETVMPEYAYFSLYHASPDAKDVDVYLNQSKVNANDFAYGDYSRGYVFATPGKHLFKLVDADNRNTILMDTSITFKKNEYYSLFFSGMAANLETLIVKDVPVESSAANDEAFIRIIHLSPDISEISVFADEQMIFTSLDFKESTVFRKIKVDEKFKLEVKSKVAPFDVLITKNDIDLSAKSYNTIVLRGLTTPPQGNTNNLKLDIVKN